MQINRTMACFIPASIAVSAVRQGIPAIAEGLPPRTKSSLKPDQCHKSFDDRSRGITAIEGTIQQGMFFRVAKFLIRDHVNAIHKGVGVVGGIADKCENLSGSRFNRNNCTTIVAHQLTGEALELSINTQIEIFTCSGKLL